MEENRKLKLIILGLIFASLAGYDIRESVNLWKRMKEANKGKEPPEWMSTHPSSGIELNTLNNWIPESNIKISTNICARD